MATAKHRAIDLFRRNKLLERKHEELGRELKSQQDLAMASFDIPEDHEISDDLLRLVFVSCHPVLSTEARVALTLRLLGGLTTQEIARAFLVPEPTVAQRIVRAKRTLTEARVPFEVPRGQELAARLSSVLEVIYLVFNEGYSATAGEDWVRPALCEDALRLGRILAHLEAYFGIPLMGGVLHTLLTVTVMAPSRKTCGAKSLSMVCRPLSRRVTLAHVRRQTRIGIASPRSTMPWRSSHLRPLWS